MPRLTLRRLVGAVTIINIWILIALVVFMTADYGQTIAKRQALTPNDTEIVSGEPLAPGQSVIENIDPLSTADSL